MGITSETRKRLWGRSGNRCAKCRAELVRPYDDDLPGALIGEEAHIVARSPGGARYEPLAPSARDGYDNLILLCANDHTEVDAQPSRYTRESLRALKRRHELWVKARLHDDGPNTEPDRTLATLMGSGDMLWELMDGVLAWQVGMPEGLTTAEEDLVDNAMQTITDWGEISNDVREQGFRSVRDAKRSLQAQLDELAHAGFVLLAGRRQGTFGGGNAHRPSCGAGGRPPHRFGGAPCADPRRGERLQRHESLGTTKGRHR